MREKCLDAWGMVESVLMESVLVENVMVESILVESVRTNPGPEERMNVMVGE